MLETITTVSAAKYAVPPALIPNWTPTKKSPITAIGAAKGTKTNPLAGIALIETVEVPKARAPGAPAVPEASQALTFYVEFAPAATCLPK